MKKKLIFVFLFFCALTSPSKAATPTLSGPSGLVLTRTADILDDGEHYISFFSQTDSYVTNNSDENNYQTLISPAYQFAVSKDLEMGVSSSYIMVDRLEGAISNIIVNGKYRLFGGREKGYGLSLTAYRSFYNNFNEKYFKKNETTIGGEINLSRYTDIASIHLSVGKSKENVFYMPEKYGSVELFNVAVALEFNPVPDLSMSIEALYNQDTDSKDQNLLIMPSFKFLADDKLSFNFAMAFAVPDNKSSRPEQKIMAGISYALHEPEKKVDEATNRLLETIGELKSEVKDLKSELATQKVDEKETDGIKEADQGKTEKDLSNAPIGPNNYFKVEVVNVSGIAGLGEALAARLKQKGFNVVKVRKANVKNKKKSLVLFKNGFAYEGERVARALPEDQGVMPSTKLPPEIEIRFVAGSDLSFLLDNKE